MQKASAAKPHAELPAKPVSSPGKSTTRIITLDFPVEFAGEMYPTLTIRRLKAKDLKALDMMPPPLWKCPQCGGENAGTGGQAQGIAMAALICGVGEEIIDELDMVDYAKVQEAVADFFPKALVDKYQPTPSK